MDLVSFNKEIVIDIKTKEIIEENKQYWFDEHVMQLAAYAKGVLLKNARLVNVFVGYNGDLVFHEWDKEEKERGELMFSYALKLWQLKKRYTPKELEEK
jgi:hypothetical protein